MNISTKNLIGSIVTLLFSTIIKVAFLAAAVWMLLHGWFGCAMASIIGAIICGWCYDDEVEK